MAEYDLIQKYYINGNPNNYIWVRLPISKCTPMMLYDYSTGQNVDIVYMNENWFASIQKLNKQNLPYAAYQRNINGIISVYIRWPNENVIYKWGDCPNRNAAWGDACLLRTAERLGEITFAGFCSINKIQFHDAKQFLDVYRRKHKAA